MNTPTFIVRKDAIPMKTIRMDSQREASRNLSLPPEKTHTKEELEALHRAIRFTHKFHAAESLAKMDEESSIIHELTDMVMAAKPKKERARIG